MLNLSELKQNNQDFEWYPTTDEIINCVRNHLYTHTYRNNSILDIGAGDGRVLKALTDDKDTQCYSIEKSEILRNRQDKDIIPLGCDFWQNTLIDKEVDTIFCNPPYAEYETWCEKIIKEANVTNGIYFVIPERYKQSLIINRALKTRMLEDKVVSLGSFDFLNAERSARAKVEVVFIKILNERYSNGSSAFDLFLDENFSFDTTSKFNEDTHRERIKNELINSKNHIESLVKLYEADMQRLICNFKAISSLDSEILEEIGFKKSTLKKSIQSRINGLKNLYWAELFDRYEPITSKFISSYRNTILGKLSSRKNIDFNIENIYAITIWFLKNASDDFGQQIIDFYIKLSEPENTRAYKSNKHFVEDTWRYLSRNEIRQRFRSGENKTLLDYRLVMSRQCFSKTDWRNNLLLTRDGMDFLRDFITVARNLGFGAENSYLLSKNYYEYPLSSGEKYYLYFSTGEVMLEFKTYKNGNFHIKVNEKLMKALNIEAGRLLGWLRSPSEASEELDIKQSDAEQYFKTLPSISVNENIKLLSA